MRLLGSLLGGCLGLGFVVVLFLFLFLIAKK